MAGKPARDYETLAKQAKIDVKSGKIVPSIHIIAREYGVPHASLETNFRKFGITTQTLRDWAAGKDNDDFDESEQPGDTIGLNQNGTMISDKLIEIMEIDMKNERKVLEAHGFDPDEWVILSYRHNYWHGQRPKDRGQVINCQSRVTCRPKTIKDIGPEDVEQFFRSLETRKLAPQVKARQYSYSGKLLEICMADTHVFRQLANPNGKSAEENVHETISDIKAKAKGKRFTGVIFVPLGDTFDADTMQRTTSHGTQQYLTGTPYQMYTTGVELMVWAINELRAIAPVRYVFVPGNHDQLISFTLAKTLEAYFKDCKDVVFDIGHEERKWHVFGYNLIAWMHGEMPRKNVFSWLQAQARKEWGETRYAEIHAGHTHTQTVEEKAGQIVRYLPSTSDSSLWEMGQGYIGNVRATVSFVWDSVNGLQEQWFTNV